MRTGTSFLRKTIVTICVMPTVFVLLGEAYTHFFNTLPVASLATRFGFTFQKPIIFVLIVIIEIILVLTIYRMLRPLLLFLDNPAKSDEKSFAAARKAAVGIPWTLIIISMGFWTLGTVVFYALSGWKSPGGTPFVIYLDGPSGQSVSYRP